MPIRIMISHRILAHCVLLAISLVSFSALSVERSEPEVLPVKIGAPIYPLYCIQKGLQGRVDAVFTVDAEGKVKDPVIVHTTAYRKTETDPVDNRKAEQAFAKAAKKALRSYRYKPQIENGHPIEVDGVKTTINFKLAP